MTTAELFNPYPREQSASEPPIAYAEAWRSERLVESAADLADAITTFDLIRAAALSRGASLDLIRAIDFGP